MTGVACVGDELFVLRRANVCIEVYDANTFSLRRTVRIKSKCTGELRAMTSCTTNRCIYVSEWERRIIYRIFVSGAVSISRWKIHDWPRGLSVNTANNLLVTCSFASEGNILEFTIRGLLVRSIKLQPDITIPVHALEIDRGLYAVCHIGCSNHRVCLVDADGNVVTSFGHKYGSDIGQLNMPRYLAVGKKKSVIVADKQNNRLVLLNADFTLSRYMAGPGLDLSGPVALHLDASRNRLYVGEWEGGRVIACDIFSLC